MPNKFSPTTLTPESAADYRSQGIDALRRNGSVRAPLAMWLFRDGMRHARVVADATSKTGKAHEIAIAKLDTVCKCLAAEFGYTDWFWHHALIAMRQIAISGADPARAMRDLEGTFVTAATTPRAKVD